MTGADALAACFRSGGPDWLFGLMLGSGGAALLALLLLLAGQELARQPVPRAPAVLALPLLSLAALVLMGPRSLVIAGPLLVVTLVGQLVRRSGPARSRHLRALLVVLALLGAVTSAGSLAGQIVLGETTPGSCRPPSHTSLDRPDGL